jgi:isopentenyldiphosphate isomerase
MAGNKSRGSRKAIKRREKAAGSQNFKGLDSLKADLVVSAAEPDNGGLFLFISFDLVNSTEFKVNNPANWPLLISSFYDVSISSLNHRISDLKIWKHVGDEVLFFKELTALSDFSELLPRVYQALHNAEETIIRRHRLSGFVFGIKATVWIARCVDLKTGEVGEVSAEYKRSNSKNLVVELNRGTVDGRTIGGQDFLGPEIDIGFRVTRFSSRGRVAVSANLALMLYFHRAQFAYVEHGLRIIAFEEMKGVWNSRVYPIVWYEDDWDKFAENSLYDEYVKNPRVKETIEKGDIESRIPYLEKIYKDLGKLDEVRLEADSLPQHKSESGNITESYSISTKVAELHCVAICVDVEGRILAEKRTSVKRRLPNHWEFGCGQLRNNETFENCIKRCYSEEFGLSISTEDSSNPIATFYMKDENERRVIPGLIFLGRCDDPGSLKKNQNSHSEVRWFSQDQLASLIGEDKVPDFDRNVERAIAMWKSREPK